MRTSSGMSERVRQAYDAAANRYAERFEHELDHKPVDRELLEHFAERVGDSGPVWEIGSGPGQIGAYVRARGVTVHGTDLSFGGLRETRRLYGNVPCAQCDMLSLPARDDTLAAILAFYSICHLAVHELAPAFREMHRALRPNAHALIAFHVGSDTIHVDDFLEQPADLDFNFYEVHQVVDALAQAGFGRVEVNEREPYPDVEHASRRAYVLAVKPVDEGR